MSSRFALKFDERFDADELDRSRWIPAYLPHWSTWERAAARYAVARGRLRLRIERDQPPWCPQLDGDLKVSSLQTALVAGEPGSHDGQHQFDPPATVRNGPHDVRHYVPRYGRFEARMTASDDPRLMVAFWMIGLGDTAERSGEICVAEIFGRDVTQHGAAIGVGVHPHADPAIVDEFERVRLPIDVRVPHDYAAEWTPDAVAFFVDGRPVKRVRQAIGYPMQLMLGLYEFPPSAGTRSTVDAYPKQITVERVRGFRYVV